VIDPDSGEDIAWAQWVIPNEKQLDPIQILTSVQPEAQKAIPATQAPSKPENQELEGENLAVVADWSAKGRAAWQRSVAGKSIGVGIFRVCLDNANANAEQFSGIS
jgi:hypothetical protein